MTKHELNAALAHRLASLVGDAAVYEAAAECRSGHPTASFQPPMDRRPGALCHECAVIQAEKARIHDYFEAMVWGARYQRPNGR